MAFAITQVFVPRTEHECRLWLHSLQVATAARSIAELMDEDVDGGEAYLAGLLHDLGRFVFLQQSPEKLQSRFEDVWCGGGDTLAAETRVFGVDHAELGGQVALAWELPERLRTTLDIHHQEDLSRLDRSTQALVAAVQIADRMSLALLRIDESEADRVETVARAAELPHVRRSPRARQLAPLILRVEEIAAEQAAALGIR